MADNEKVNRVNKKNANMGIKSENKEDKQLVKSDELGKNDFIELEFTGKTKGGEIFDTNIKEQAEKINPNFQPKLIIICLGQAMILPSIDEFLIGKSLGKYELELTPEQAFGSRNPKLIKTMPISVFKNQETPPHPGMVFQFDNMFARVSAVSGGRVIADFNNPLAGKPIIYELDARKKIANLDEKIKSLISFFFRQDLEYEVKDKKLIIKCQPEFEKFVLLFKQKFKEILDLELEAKTELVEKEQAKKEQEQANRAGREKQGG